MANYDLLNPEQKEATFHGEGPLLILAGAGSGKTRVITHRIAYLIEHGVNPWHILAITFTNKAAREMRERVDKLIGFGSEDVWVGTFHRLCVYLLRCNISETIYENNFIIYDTDDQKTLMKEVIKYLDLDPKKYKERTILSAISNAKNELITPEEYMKNAGSDYSRKKIAECYMEYQKRLEKNNALDFDDLIMKTVELLKTHPEVRTKYQQRFQYVMVDEYQDTNTAQFELVSLLAPYEREDGSFVSNLCVVGDDDQSIYKFRGANIYNILNFEKQYANTKVIRLEQNYRSTGNILTAANEVIAHNTERKSKTLWTEQEDGDPIYYTRYENDLLEADGIAKHILAHNSKGNPFRDCAILYRTNAQSRKIEEQLIRNGIPYKIFGGINFYQRKEIKDILAYLRTINNGTDDISVKRIINVPKRGIGLTSMDKLSSYAESTEMSFYDACVRADSVPGLGAAASKISPFVSMIEILKGKLSDPDYTLVDLFDELMEYTHYHDYIRAYAEDEIKADDHINNINEFRNRIVEFVEASEEPATLDSFLEDISLVADVDSVDENAEQVTLMTLHSAKGLEFPVVFLCGMEMGLFPGYRTMESDDPTEMEEERRLCYVGITRAMKQLYISCARSRMQNGEMQFNQPSCFINEIPRFLLKNTGGSSLNISSGSTRSNSSECLSTNRTMSFGTKAAPKTTYTARTLDQHPLISKGFPGFKSDAPAKATPKPSHLSPYTAPKPAAASASSPSRIDYSVGDTVSHIKFGHGVVTSIEKGSRDYEVTVEFETAGKKKMLAGFANLKKC